MGEGALQFLQLLEGKRGTVTSLFPSNERIIVDGWMVGITRICKMKLFQGEKNTTFWKNMKAENVIKTTANVRND